MRSQRTRRFVFGMAVSSHIAATNVVNDPDCLRNLASDPQRRLRKEELSTVMVNELCAQGDPRMEGRGEVFEQYTPHDPCLCNNYERFMRRHETGETIEAGWINSSDIETIEE